MDNLEIAFDRPWFLLGLALIPLLWFWSFRSLAGLGRWRRIFALLLRATVLTLLILALARMQFLRSSDRVTVIYLLDQSASIPATVRDAMVDYVVEDVEQHRDDARRDRASVIVFGRQANIEVPPLDADLPLVNRLETLDTLRSDATNLEGAMKLAQATFPEDSTCRVVILSDGNENLGNASEIAMQLAEDGVGIDVIPIWLQRNNDVAVERVSLPSDIRRGQPFEARVVVNNRTPVTELDDGRVSGKLRLVRRQGSQETTLDEMEVELPAGKTVYRFSDEIEESDFFEYQARFVADDGDADTVLQNNRATSFTQVRGKGHVLIIEDWENRAAGGVGEFDYLAQRLRAAGLEVTVQFTDAMFGSLAELQRFDTVLLANVPRSSGSTAENMTHFSDRQMETLVQNTQQMGCGLVMLGGPNSYGAGGWANSPLEEAMPVDFQIRNAKVQAVGALAMVMHASEMPEGNYWQKIIGREAVNALGPQDYCAVVEWKSGQGREGWLWGGASGFLPVGGNQRMMIGRLDRMTPGDMPDFDPSMKMALSGFSTVKAAAVKHMIIISDGDPTPPSSRTLNGFKQAGVKVTTVAVGAHGTVGSTRLRNIAQTTGGKYYVVRSPNALPKIYQREARRVSRPVVVERPIQAQVTARHEILQGIDGFPPLSGFTMTTVKENPLVEVSLLSDYPSDRENATLLATWNYGLGRAVAFTSDAGSRWAKQWTGWEEYDKFFSQLVRWSMRPTGDTGSYSVVTRVEDGKLKVIVDALDKNDEFLNFLNFSGTVLSPDMAAQGLNLRQTAPGRYVGEVEVAESGSYFVSLMPAAGQAPIRTGVNVPYSPEFNDRETNVELLKSLAQMEPVGGEPGTLVEGGFVPGELDELLGLDPFRRTLAKAVSGDAIWPLLLLVASAVFFSDVFVRRVAIGFEWLSPILARVGDVILRRTPEAEPDQQMARLRSRKAEVGDELAQRKASARFEPDAEEEVDLDVLTEQAQRPTKQAAAKAEPSLGPAEEEQSFTSRLLKAKEQAQRKKEGGRDDTASAD